MVSLRDSYPFNTDSPVLYEKLSSSQEMCTGRSLFSQPEDSLQVPVFDENTPAEKYPSAPRKSFVMQPEWADSLSFNETDSLKAELYRREKSKDRHMNASAPGDDDMESDIRNAHVREIFDPVLRKWFGAIVEELSLDDVLVLAEDRVAPPQNMADYCLVPVVALDAEQPSLIGAGSNVAVPEGVETNYQINGGLPYLDTGLAVGLVYRDELCALAGGCITPDSELYIMQLQAVTNKAGDARLKYKSGLHNGFYWRDTLVEAWDRIARRLQLGELRLQSAAHNAWANPEKAGYERFVRGYDEVAERMGFTLDPALNDWVRPVDVPAVIGVR